MAESFEKLGNILRDWLKIKYKNVLRGIEQVREAGKSKKKPFLF